MAGRTKLSFHHRVMLVLLALCGLLVSAFLIFQYQREKTFRFELLNMELQMHNDRIIDGLSKGIQADSVIRQIDAPFSDLRITVIGKDGYVMYDNNDRTPFPTSNHNNRPEIIQARKNGVGYSVERKSVSDQADYFYSAKLSNDSIIVRSAAPYTHSLHDFLKADSTFIWIMLSFSFIVCLCGYFITRRISTSITRLNSFAEKAGNGERIYNDWAFPHDELGSIATNIVRLYAQRERVHQEAIRQERDKIRLKKQLTNNINHELKTPVASIQICADLLRDHPEIDEHRRVEFIERICDNVRRLTSMLQDVASITRMDDGADVITKEPIDIKALVDDIVENARLRTDMEIITNIPYITINGNKSLLESLFRNLIDNAIAYSGGSEINISADCEGNFVFRDNGIGIPDEHLPHIFERFYRIDKGRSREKGGTGLGLAIVKNAIAIHGGNIHVTNDNGLRFDFRIS